MNVYNEHPFKVLMDYGHNAHAVGVMAELAQRLDVTGRRIVVLAGPGDRRDEDLRAIADAVAGKFDHYICRRDDSLRGRDGDEVPRIMARALQAAGVAEDAISQIPDEQLAVGTALKMGSTGDLVLVFADALTRTWKQIIRFTPDGDMPRPTPRAEIPDCRPRWTSAWWRRWKAWSATSAACASSARKATEHARGHAVPRFAPADRPQPVFRWPRCGA